MARVVSIERYKRGRLAGELATLLLDRGSAVCDVSEVEDVAEWRAAGRHAGRIVGWRVRTGVSRGPERTAVWVASDDYPVDPADLRAAGERITAYLLTVADQSSGARPHLSVVGDGSGVKPRSRRDPPEGQ